jgi:hypothetical protein
MTGSENPPAPNRSYPYAMSEVKISGVAMRCKKEVLFLKFVNEFPAATSETSLGD